MSYAIAGKFGSWRRKKPPLSSLQKQEQTRLAADIIASIVVLLMAIGTVFVFSASMNIGYGIDFEKFYDYPGLRQIIFFPLACLIMYIFSRINFRTYSMDKGWYKNPVVYLLLISIVLLSLILVQRFIGIFPEDGFIPYINKHYRWLQIPLGSFTVSFQPSELAKWMTVFLIAALVDRFGDEIKLFWKRFVPICLIVGLIMGLIIVEDFGTAALIALIAFLMLIISGVKLCILLRYCFVTNENKSPYRFSSSRQVAGYIKLPAEPIFNRDWLRRPARQRTWTRYKQVWSFAGRYD